MQYPQIEQLSGANTAVSPFLQPQNAPTVLNGCNVSYRLGAILKDTGYSRVGNAASSEKIITGLHNFRQTAFIQKILRTKNNDAATNLLLQYNNSGTWTDINVGATYNAFEDSIVEMADFIGYCFIVGYDSTDNVFLPVGSLTGTTFSTVTNVTSMPQGKYVIRYRDRVYVSNTFTGGTAFPFRTYFSSVPAAGAITWTPASDFFDVDFSEQITGIGTNWDILMLFTEYSAYMYDQDKKRQVWSTGCSNHRTIATQSVYMFFANSDGVWISTSGQPLNISGPVIDFFRTTNPTNWFAKIVDEEYHIFVGDPFVNGITYTNCVLTYNIATSTWRWREYADQMLVFEKFNDSGTQRLFMGATNGEVYNKAKYTDVPLISSDDGEPIHGNFELAPIHLSILSKQKRLKGIVAFAERAQGLNLKYRILDKNKRVLTPFMQLGQLTKYVSSFDVANDNGILIQVSGEEFSINPYFSFLGLELNLEADEDIPKIR